MKTSVLIVVMMMNYAANGQFIRKVEEKDFDSHTSIDSRTLPQQTNVNRGTVDGSINTKPANLPSDISGQRQREQNAVVDDLLQKNRSLAQRPVEDYKSPEFIAKTQKYTQALQALQQMLNGKAPQSLAKAYYIIESATGNTYQTEEKYNQTIKKNAVFIKHWMAQNGYDTADNEALNKGIQKFMSEKLDIVTTSPKNENGLSVKTISHLPYYYDYNDFQGDKDQRNTFVTKCLATGAGQCNSLPAVYMILAEALGAKAYMSFAPQHAFIKYPLNNGALNNYEVTSNTFINDKWYQDNLFITADAVRSGIYLDTLSKRQIIANCVTDLAVSYLKTYGAANGKFITECISTTMKNYNGKNNIETYFLYSSMLVRLLQTQIEKQNLRTKAQIQASPLANGLMEALQLNEERIKKLGYQPMPAGAYENIMNTHMAADSLQRAHRINGKEPRDLFLETK